MDGVFQPFGDPVAGEGDEDDEANDGGGGAGAGTAGAGAGAGAGRVAPALGGFVADVDGDEGDGEPGAEGDGDEAADGGDEEDVAEAAGDVHGLLQHDDGEGDAGDPGDEAENGEDAEDGEDDGGGVVVLDAVVDGGAEGEDDVENAGDPDELFGEHAGGEEVGPGGCDGDDEDEGEEDDGVGVEGEGVGGVVDSAAGEGFVGAVAGDG